MESKCLRETARWALYAQNPFGVPRAHHHFSNPPAATRRNGCASCSGLRPETPQKGQCHDLNEQRAPRNQNRYASQTTRRTPCTSRQTDALYYYILSWPPGEVPVRTQWHDAVQHTLASLGFAEHQYVAVALKKGEHFSVHIMVNRVHPETFKAHTPSWSYCALSIACRELEAKYGWQPTRGIFRWDDLTQTVVRIPPHLRSSYSNKEPVQVPTDTALDRCSTRATLLAYLRHHLALRVRTLLLRNHATWADLHSLLAEHQLRFERRRGCTYTIFNPQHNVRVKASDVFLHNFGGKHARRLTERQLGPWTEM
jgi:hypothetical protein